MEPDQGIIIVSGTSGRIGDAVMPRLVSRFDTVIGFDRREHPRSTVPPAANNR